jgi:alkylation response protein AidB-like acyl-CoA dehydrogenase
VHRSRSDGHREVVHWYASHVIDGTFPTLSEEHEAFRKVVRDFADREVAPHAAGWDERHEFPLDLVKKMGEMGLFGLVYPEEWGGSGGDFTSLCIAIEELGRADQSVGITLSAGVGLGINPIFTFGSDAQKARWLPDLVAGRTLGAFGLTEPDGGSDAGATRTRAVFDAKARTWTLNGSKAFITNSGTAMTSVITVTARTEDGKISSFLVPAGTPGLIVEPAYRKLGWHASDTHGLTFVDCVLPEDALLGQPGRGFSNFLAILDDGRIAISALALGLTRACLEMSVDYAKSRQAFGGPIGRFQSLAFALSDLAVKVENSRNLVYKAAHLKDTGQPFKEVAAIAKLYTTEAAVEATRVATQVFGGMGFTEEVAVARFYRDAKILEIGEGTSEIQRLVIARALGLPVA